MSLSNNPDDSKIFLWFKSSRMPAILHQGDGAFIECFVTCSLSTSIGIEATFVHLWPRWHFTLHNAPFFLHGQLFHAVHRE